MTRLNQIIALEKGVKTKAYADISKLHHEVGKTQLLSGISRTYKPRDDDGEQFPPESTRVQLKVGDVLEQVANTLTRLFDLTLTKDSANQQAKADIVLSGGVVLAKDVPVSYLLFLEKQLTDLGTFVAKLPLLDPSEKWDWDETTDSFATEPSQTVKTKKIPRNHVLAEATDRHPAQVQVFTEDSLVGYWTTVKYSGALPAHEVNNMKTRVTILAEAVKVAREAANSIEVVDRKIAGAVFSYLFDV